MILTKNYIQNLLFPIYDFCIDLIKPFVRFFAGQIDNIIDNIKSSILLALDWIIKNLDFIRVT